MTITALPIQLIFLWVIWTVALTPFISSPASLSRFIPQIRCYYLGFLIFQVRLLIRPLVPSSVVVSIFESTPSLQPMMLPPSLPMLLLILSPLSSGLTEVYFVPRPLMILMTFFIWSQMWPAVRALVLRIRLLLHVPVTSVLCWRCLIDCKHIESILKSLLILSVIN